MTNKNSVISAAQAEKIALDLFGINGMAQALHGERDFNFKITVKKDAHYILKISHSDIEPSTLEFQQQLLSYIEEANDNICTPKIIKDLKGNKISEIIDKDGCHRKARLLTYISGRLWSAVNPQLDELRFDLGYQCGLLTKVLQNFKHPQAHEPFVWDVAQSLWTKDHLHLFDDEQKEIISYFQVGFEKAQNTYSKLRKSVVHNDANDNNILVSLDVIAIKVLAIIDYGDAIYTQIINDVAIACAYAIMHHKDPLQAALPIVKGYHAAFPLEESELIHLYNAIAMRLVITVTKAAINKTSDPTNSYLQISETPAWDLLKKWRQISSQFAYFSLREACGFTAHPNQDTFQDWMRHQNLNVSELFPTIAKNKISHLDLSVSSTWLGHQTEFSDLELFQFKINQLQKQVPNQIIAGGYLEPRPLYTATSYDKIGNYGRESRTVHLGVDFWLPAETPVHALFDGEIITAVNDAGDKEYGGLIILRHTTTHFEFFTLYGHLSVQSVLNKKIGERIKKGDCIGHLGTYPENGNWSPHLHFQVMLSLLDYKIDFPGVIYFNQLPVWKSICPDPNLLFKSKALIPKSTSSNDSLISFRKAHLGKSLILQYEEPIKMVRGAGQYLMDANGRCFLDTVNNVAHVGHEHPDVVKAGQQQMALINTNTRYLHENINILAQALLETLPPELCVVHFVNSGSEANDLAIRMSKTFTGEKDIIASEVGYHGNTSTCIDISSYKFDGKGGQGAPEHTHIFPLPDAFRGKYRGADSGEKYAEEVSAQIKMIQAKGRKPAAFIIEPIISCGGQIELPHGFLSKAYEHVRKAGGLCISDEVQVGCGRLGKTFWGFQFHEVIPDIITIGKPLGNGHPIAAVVCTKDVAEKFANGMEYFNTFGGNPVSCAIANEVLKIVKREKLQEHALQTGEFLKAELKQLSKEFPILADVRGQGLFLGIELTDAALNPLPEQTAYLANRMRDFGILMSTDGPDHNVLKIKPPLVFTKDNAKELVYYLKQILSEDFMTHLNN